MTELLTAAQMRAIEQAAIESGEVTGLELMERAGRGVVEAIFEEWPDLAKTSHKAVVLCGPGNNGGDGFVVARLLKEQGWEVEVFLYGDPDKLPPDARVNYERCGKMGEISDLDPEEFELDPTTTNNDTVIIDALFGIGLTRPVHWNPVSWTLMMSSAFSSRNSHHWPSARVVAIDMPSGLDSDAGDFLRPDPVPLDFETAAANLTVTFHRPKLGHYLSRGPDSCGRVSIVDLGLTDSARSAGANVTLITGAPATANKTGDHKYSHGHALILSGPPGKTGAARLAARGALRIGAGLVTLGCPEAALPEVAAQVTTIMTRTINTADALAKALGDDRLNALCLGPGLGLDDHAGALVKTALGRGSSRRIVLDADALTLLSRSDTPFAELHESCVLTPHAGEFKRLFPDIAEKLDAPASSGPAYSKVDATREAAARAGCTVLFKGPDTVIADQTGRCSINASVHDRAAPWLATAGAGDVLAGFITGLLARGFAPMQAAETAAWLHTECALSFGPGLIAEDLPEELPAVLKQLLQVKG